MWTCLKKKGIPTKIVNIIQSLYNGSTCHVIHDGLIGPPIPISTGVKQGCLLSPLLFIIILDDIMRQVSAGSRGIPWRQGQLEDLDYADDIVLLSKRLSDMQSKIEDLQREGGKYGLKINASKTESMKVSSSSTEHVTLGNSQLKLVDTFCYLGCILTNKGGADMDIDNRIKKAKAAFAQLAPVWKSHIMPLRLKLSIFESNVKSVLLYGCETWRTTKLLHHKLQVTVNRCLRSILRIYWPDTISNVDLWKKCNQTTLRKEIAMRRWRWIGHTMRRHDCNHAQVAFEWQPSGRRRPGRPVQSWRRSVEAEMKRAGLSWAQVKEAAQDREAWRRMSVALSSTGE
ncbi:hypothetical protein JYU34_004574 [Plutella xylostella]|nr:hypothetical protein JYU34_004574 [Plutella xylostella]